MFFHICLIRYFLFCLPPLFREPPPIRLIVIILFSSRNSFHGYFGLIQTKKAVVATALWIFFMSSAFNALTYLTYLQWQKGKNLFSFADVF